MPQSWYVNWILVMPETERPLDSRINAALALLEKYGTAENIPDKELEKIDYVRKGKRIFPVERTDLAAKTDVDRNQDQKEVLRGWNDRFSESLRKLLKPTDSD